MRILFFILIFNINLAYANKISVIVSIPPQQLILEELAGDWLAISVLVEARQNPENWSPKPQQLAKLSQAVLFFQINLPFEQIWQTKIQHLNPKIKIVPFSLDLSNVNNMDPHTWLNPQYYRYFLKQAVFFLKQYLPKHQAIIQQRGKKIEQKINRLIAETRQTLASIKHRKFWVYHPAWGHFAAYYGLTQVAIQQQGKTPSTRALIQLIKKATQQKINTIFIQPQHHSHEAAVLAKSLNAQEVMIDPLQKDYFKNMKQVAEKIAKALQ